VESCEAVDKVSWSVARVRLRATADTCKTPQLLISVSTNRLLWCYIINVVLSWIRGGVFFYIFGNWILQIYLAQIRRQRIQELLEKQEKLKIELADAKRILMVDPTTWSYDCECFFLPLVYLIYCENY